MAAQLASKTFEAKGFEIKIKPYKEASLSAVAKSLLLRLPIEIDLRRPEGIFTVEASGTMNLDMRIDIHIHEDFALQTTTQLQDYQWIESPRVKVGSVQMPLETLVDAVIRNQEPELCRQVDQMIRKFLDLRGVVATTVARIYEGIPIMDGLRASAQVDGLNLSSFMEADGYIVWNVYPQFSMHIAKNEGNGTIPELPKVDWVHQSDGQARLAPVECSMYLDYDTLASLIVKKTKGMEVGGKEIELSGVTIEYQDGLKVQLGLRQPLKGHGYLKAHPIYNQADRKLYLHDVDISVHADSLLYKLVSPLINKWMEGRVEALFPMAIEDILREEWESRRTQLPQWDPIRYTFDISKIEIKDINFQYKGIHVDILLHDAEVEARVL